MALEWVVVLIFAAVVTGIITKPWGVNEAVPALIGGVLVVALGVVGLSDLRSVFQIVSSPAVIDLSTVIMATILDRAGFFRWAAQKVAIKANGSGKRLLVYAMLLSFFMTLFFNNDGSILITTPILVEMVKRLKLKPKQAIPILLGSALIASASSAPIGVSNIANLIALKIVGLNLNVYAELMFLPSMLGIAVCGSLLYLLFRKPVNFQYDLRLEPKPVLPPPGPGHKHHHLLDLPLFRFGITVVVAVRFGFFAASAMNIPPQLVAVVGALILLMYYLARKPRELRHIIRAVPWHVFLFVFGMYLLVFALKNIGLTSFLGQLLVIFVGRSLLGHVYGTGILLTIMSTLMNNLPAVMIGTTVLTQMHLPVQVLQMSYLASILGSDVGSLLVPMGTLASLLWFYIIGKSFRFSWWDYMRVSFLVIVPSLIVSLMALWGWGLLTFPHA